MNPSLASPRCAAGNGTPASGADDYDGRWRVFAVIVVGAFMAQLDLFIVNIAFPAIARSFAGVSASTLSWISEADPTWAEWSFAATGLTSAFIALSLPARRASAVAAHNRGPSLHAADPAQ